MSAPATRTASRPFPIRAQFKAWRVLENGEAQPIDVSDAVDWAEAVQSAAVRCAHKDVFVVVGSGEARFHRIRQGKREYRLNPETGVPGWHTPLFPDELFRLAVAEFSPVEPWRWAPGCDVVGIDRSTIEMREQS